MFRKLPAVLLIAVAATIYAAAENPVIHPGAVWLDNGGRQIQAHGGGVLQMGNTFYWFGEDRTQSLDADKRYVSCYSSRDLVRWTFRSRALQLSDPENLGLRWVLERPKVFYNVATKKFVMYMHLDDARYKLARVAVAVSDKVDGPYQYVRSFRPLDQESRDIGQFVDDDGSAYILFEARPTGGFYIAKLADDDLSVTKQMSFVHAPLEGGALVHYKGLYYVIGSHMSGWKPNPNVYATSTSLEGPWTEFQSMAPPEMNNYESQSTMLLKVTGKKTSSVIFMGDIWKPKSLWDSRYLWMPLEIGDGKMTLPAPHDWTINMKSGESRILP